MAKKNISPKKIETLTHDSAKRKNIPTAEYESVVNAKEKNSIRVKYPRNIDIDPQLVWRGKDAQDWSDLIVNAPPLYIQEKIHPKALIDELLKESRENEFEAGQITADLFSDFNGIPKDTEKTEFYQHDQNWTNRMVLGDSLQVMASLAEREGLRGQIQCIYFDPPYGIKFNSNFQWSTTSRDVKDGKSDHITREPEQVKAFRDTWRDGVHSYLTYLRDRLTVARDLLTDSGSIFVQIGEENVHRLRAVLDEVFGDENFVSLISVKKTAGLGVRLLPNSFDYVVWYAKNKEHIKYRALYAPKEFGYDTDYDLVEKPDGVIQRLAGEDSLADLPAGAKLMRTIPLISSGYTESCFFDFDFKGKKVTAKKYSWKTTKQGVERLIRCQRLMQPGEHPYFKMYSDDFPYRPIVNLWADTRASDMMYVVQTANKVIERCLHMTTDPGDLVLDPTCGSGTTATVAEQWGRRWITIDTSRVALALARARIMGARYPFYLLADSHEGQLMEAEITRTPPSSQTTQGNIRHGFVYERVPHITLSQIANNTEIDVIWEQWQLKLESLRAKLNTALKKSWKEWEIPREVDTQWADAVKNLYFEWWQAWISCQEEINKSIASKADFEYLYDKPYVNKKSVRVAGPFTVESLSPHRTFWVDENDELIDSTRKAQIEFGAKQSFEQVILENLKIAGVQQAHKQDRITFSSLVKWPGNLVCAEGKYFEGEYNSPNEKRAAIFIGSEFGTVQRADLVEAAKEAGDAGFDALIACAFNYEAHATELNKLGGIPILKARMNADLHMSEDLKNTGKGNLFVIFGEPDISIINVGENKISVKVNGVDVFKPQTGEVISDDVDGIACWFIDTDYDEESFFVRHAYFLGANDPYNSLKSTLKAEINKNAWATLNSDTSRPFPKPKSGRIAVKVINHLGDEVMKVFKV